MHAAKSKKRYQFFTCRARWCELKPNKSAILIWAGFKQGREALGYLITLIRRAKKKRLHVLSVFTENIGGEQKKKIFVVRDEALHYLRGPRFQPA